jgi:hypothetical protein
MKPYAAAVFVLAAGCGLTTMRVAPVKVEPIHMTVDINLHDEKPSGDSATTPGKKR